MSNEASKYTKSATVERAREMLKRLHDRNQRTWDDLDRDVAFAIEALIASAERYRFIAHGTQAEQAQPVGEVLNERGEVDWISFVPPSGAQLYTAPPPRQPLTDEQLEKGRDQTFSINNPFCPCDSKTFRKVARWVEVAHGIKGEA